MRILLALLLMCNIAFADGLNARTSYTDYTQDANCVGAWRFNRDTADMSIETSGADYHGTFDTGMTYTASGKEGHCYNFNGADDIIKMGDVLDFTTNAMSVVLWFKTGDSTIGINERMISKGENGANYGWHVQILTSPFNEGGIAFGDSAGFKYTDADYDDTNWHHVAGVYTGGSGFDKLSIYIDGVLESGVSTAGTFTGFSDTTQSLGVGAEYDDGVRENHFFGHIDEVIVFDKALTAVEVRDIYTYGLK